MVSHAGRKSRLAPQPSGSQTSNWSYSNPLGMRILLSYVGVKSNKIWPRQTPYCVEFFSDLKAMLSKVRFGYEVITLD